ncbi:uncharacterized protein METZ01_LOCUS476412, partial [marine metagenome]
YDLFTEDENFHIINFILYFEPHTNIELFSPNGTENILNIEIEAMEIYDNITTQIIINELAVNEIRMDDSNWEGGEIIVMVPSGCTDELACNYDPNANEDDGSCAYELDCLGECGGDAVYDQCDVCNGTESNPNNCTCTEENIIYDCNGDCPPIEDCPDEFSFTIGCAYKDTNCNNVCVGGATERYPCDQDCSGIWGGYAYEDNCGMCISNTAETIIPGVLDSLDCFNSSFKIFNSDGIEEDDLI